VRAKLDTRHNAILLPQRAVMEAQGAYRVATVNETNGVHVKSVQVGEQVGNEWLINGGIEPNERVIVEGNQRVKEGAVVDPQPFGAPATNGPAGPPKS